MRKTYPHRFIGGRFDGQVFDGYVLARYMSSRSLRTQIGDRYFILMPLANYPWFAQSVVVGDPPQEYGFDAYERPYLNLGDGYSDCFFRNPDELWKAILESRLTINERAKTAISTLGLELRTEIVDRVAQLQKSPPGSWPEKIATPIPGGDSSFLVHLPDSLVGFVRVVSEQPVQIEFIDLASSETLRKFQELVAPATLHE